MAVIRVWLPAWGGLGGETFSTISCMRLRGFELHRVFLLIGSAR